MDAARGFEGALQERPPERGGSPATLSIGQEGRLRFLKRRLQAGERPPRTYVPIVIRFHGSVHGSQVERALRTIVRRHEALRTGFHLGREGSPSAFVARSPSIDLDAQVVSGTGPQDVDIAEQVASLDVAGLLVDRPPLLRLRLLTLSGRGAVLVGAADHLIFDGWSVRVFFSELVALLRDPDADLGDVVSMSAWARWQRERLSGREKERLVSRWMELLEGTDGDPVLPRAAERSTGEPSLAFVQARLGPGNATIVQSRAAAHRTTVFGVTLAAVAQAVMDLTGLSDIVLRAAFANRIETWHFNLIGCLVHPVPVRLRRPTVSPALDEWTRVAARAISASLPCAEVPLSMLMRELETRGVYLHGHGNEVTCMPMYDTVTEQIPGGRAELLPLEPELLRLFGLDTVLADSLLCYLDLRRSSLTLTVAFDRHRLREDFVRAVVRRFTEAVSA